jgi:hypothetical protein
MIVPGCLLVLLLPALGAMGGHWLAGDEGASWGLAAGLALGLGVFGLLAWAMARLQGGS